MGTLFDQPVRQHHWIEESHIDSALDNIEYIIKKRKMSVSEAVSVLSLLQHQRQNNLYQANGDIWDEQMAGFGELIRSIYESLDTVVDIARQHIDPTE